MRRWLTVFLILACLVGQARGQVEMVTQVPTLGAATVGDVAVLSNTVADSSAIANTLTETAFSQSFTVAANTLDIGRVLHVRAQGKYSTTATPTLKFTLRWGGVNTNPLLFSSGLMTTASGAANLGWTVDVYVTVRTVGASGTAVAGGFAMVSGAASTAGVLGTDSTSSTTTIDTTAATALTLFATWSASSSSNTVTMEQFIVEELG